MSHNSPHVQVLQASVDPDSESEFRILINGTSVRYVTIDTGLYSVDEMCFGPSLVTLLPPLPPGNWNQAHVDRDPTTGVARFTMITKTVLPGIMSLWHPINIDHLDLKFGEKLRSNVYEVASDQFPSPAVAKFARFSWEIPQLETETMIYKCIEGHQIGPEFLGHLTEEGRVIGFIIARVVGCRPATLEDLDICRTTLTKLHQLGIKHGDTNKHNFLVQQGTATLIDFDCASRTASIPELEDELSRLPEDLSDASERGGRYVEVVTEEH